MTTTRASGDQTCTIRGSPLVSDVRGTLFVVALSRLDRCEAMALVEAPGSVVRLKRPELQSAGPGSLRNVDEARSQPFPGTFRIDVELVDPVVMKDKQGDDHRIRLDDPDLPGGNHDVSEPGPNIVVGVNRPRDGGPRCCARSKPEVGDVESIRRSGTADIHDAMVTRLRAQRAGLS